MKKNITIRIEEETIERAKKLAKAKGWGLSMFIREVLEKYMGIKKTTV
jgi:predicted DNA binding CopG/RHH family protein